MSEKKTLKDFTEEIKSKIPDTINQAVEPVINGQYFRDFKKENAEKAIFFNYEDSKYERPVVIVTENIYECQVFCTIIEKEKHIQDLISTELKKIKSGKHTTNYDIEKAILAVKNTYIPNKIENSYVFTLNVYSNGYYAWYEFIRSNFNIKIEANELFQKYFGLQKASGIYSGIFLENVAIISKYPKKIYRNNQKNLHNSKGEAVVWNYSDKRFAMECFYWNGLKVPKEWILNPETITKNVILSETNAENRRCLMEILGAKEYYNRITDGKGLRLIDEDTDHQGFPMKLWETINTDEITGEKTQFLEVIDPSTERVYNIYPPKQNAKNVWDAKSQTFNNEQLMFRQGDVGIVNLNVKDVKKPLIET